MPPAEPALSIDYGTSNTVAVLRTGDGRAETLLFDGAPLLASAVWLDHSGVLLTGRDAQHSARLDPSRYEPNPKHRIDEAEVFLGDKAVPVTDAIAATLARVVDEATRTAGTLPAQVRMTHPAGWGGPRRQVLADAAAQAGLVAPVLVAEPVAAALYFAQVLHSPVPLGGHVVVYDLGAGTLDVAIVARNTGGWDVVAVDGLDDLGGLDIDALVLGCVAAGLPDEAAGSWAQLMQPQTAEQRRAARVLWEDAATAKEMLSRATTASVHVPLVNRATHVTRGELEAAARPRLVEAAQLTRRLLDRAGVGPFGTGLFLVGGSSRIPLVATTLLAATRIAPTVLDRPELVVATGALIADTVTPPSAVLPPPTGVSSGAADPHTRRPAATRPPAAVTAAASSVSKPAAPSPAPTAAAAPSTRHAAAQAGTSIREARKQRLPAVVIDLPEPPSPGRRRARRALVAAVVVACLAGLLAIYAHGGFTPDGRWGSTPDACATTFGDDFESDFAAGHRTSTRHGTTSICHLTYQADPEQPELTEKPARPQLAVKIERFSHDGTSDGHTVADSALFQRAGTLTGSTVHEDVTVAGQSGYTVTSDDRRTGTAACTLDNLLVTVTVTFARPSGVDVGGSAAAVYAQTIVSVLSSQD